MALRIVTRLPEPYAIRAEPAPRPEPRKSTKLKRFDAFLVCDSPESKKWTEVKDSDRIVDYQNVTLKGYLSTFKDTTESDRDGDYVEPGAFQETIPKFMRNPVLLVNHRNTVEDIAGRFTKMVEDKKGLYVEAELSNSPADWVKDVRFKVAEGSLRSMSMGGIFHYKEDGRGIFKVSLFEGSLTPVPANQDALFAVREVTSDDMKRLATVT